MKAIVQGVAHITSVDVYAAVGPSLGSFDLKKSSFEPIWDIPLADLTLGVAFLETITFARQVSEMVVLSCKEPYLVMNRGTVGFTSKCSFFIEGSVWFLS